MPAICDWRLDEKLDVLRTPKPGDYPGSRAAGGADMSKIQFSKLVHHHRSCKGNKFD